jgi:hypothetical protein
MISSIWTNIFADSGEGLLLRQSETAVVFLPITRDARSASPPLCKPVTLYDDSNRVSKTKTLPRVPNLLADAADLSRAHLQPSSNCFLHPSCILGAVLLQSQSQQIRPSTVCPQICCEGDTSPGYRF